MKATPYKLRDGRWGVKVAGQARAGQLVTVEAKSGKTWGAMIEKVLFSNDEISLCSTVEARRERPTRSGKWCECGFSGDMLSVGYRPGQRVTCPECGGIAEAS